MKVKTNDLVGTALDWAVAKAQGWVDFPKDSGGDRDKWFLDAEKAPFCEYRHKSSWKPSTEWGQGGPIIERERIWTAECSGAWSAKPALNFDKVERPDTWASSPLEAAMRCYVASKLGDEVDVPEALL